jgi:glycosyltransferase involved in cell wall biosynthesis
MMKVAYFIGSLNRGGTEMLTLDICRKKSYAPYEIILIYRNDGELTEEFKATGVPMFRIKPRGAKIGYFGELRKLVKKENVSVVHAQTLTNAAMAVLFTLFTKVKLVASFHGFFRSKSMSVLRRVVMWNADAMVFVSGFVRDWYMKRSLFFPKQRCMVVYNGINFEKFDKEYETPDFLEARCDDVGKLKFVMVGNFVSVRSQIVICKSLKLLKDQGVTNFDFYFVGKRVDSESWRYDECVGYCEQYGLMDFVHFIGSRGDVPAILQHVDGFIYSTFDDTFGIAVVEAMAVGIPVIVNDWDVMKEITHQGKYATLFETENEEDCAMKIKELVASIESSRNNALKNVEKVRELYSIEKHIMSLYEIYKTLSK